LCTGHLDVADVERRFGLRFADYFARELALLTGAGSPASDGLVDVDAASITVTPLGRPFVRNVCMAFDRYLAARTGGATPVFSKTV
jgi:oxygen-independent coproporphyrinogen-3 oxidase